ncbi:MAG: SDR family NAD(P)-dependent oxidoreductase [Deltaproteobacteria bacterium]|nr:SDR family NAD(P)-dependent oxidoreductase [Deltaproteobacteria bacterium]
MEKMLKGKVAAITGASSGIGEATAVMLAEAGAVVSLGARRADRLDALAKKIQSAGGKALAIETDITQESEARGFIERTQKELGRLDILVNNAGVMLLGPVIGADTNEWRRMVEVNILGLLYCTHAALPIMLEQGGGDIVNISSIAGRRAAAGAAVYNFTKFRVCGFSEALRQEVNRGKVRVTTIEPGFVETELAGHSSHPMIAPAVEKMKAEIGEVLKSEDIARGILYAVSQPPHVSVNEVLIRPTGQRQ